MEQVRKENPLLGADLREAASTAQDTHESDQYKIDLRGAKLSRANLQGIDLSFADLYRASLWRSDLSKASLRGADLSSVTLNSAKLTGADLTRANLRFARLTAADVSESVFSEAFVYGSSIWNLIGQPKEQVNVVITPPTEPMITVDNVELAQFIFGSPQESGKMCIWRGF